MVPPGVLLVVLMGPQNGKFGGKLRRWAGTRGAAPGSRCGGSMPWPWAARGTFYAPVVGGKAPKSRQKCSGAARFQFFVFNIYFSHLFGKK